MSHVDFTLVVVVLKSLTLLLGGVITYYSYRAYQRTGAPALRALAIGFGIITLGALFGGAVDQLLPLEPNAAFATESAFTAAGFAVIVYSLFVE
ncbi:DUF7521 family protein [Halorarius litoreus]|uniref:DUF7521 family protein n=1 Tax=Halorarius litoreus TaxID=2962676 RepID=UPI0020CCC3F1|nr:hypothetical protein [Halorarius litoreus]